MKYKFKTFYNFLHKNCLTQILIFINFKSLQKEEKLFSQDVSFMIHKKKLVTPQEKPKIHTSAFYLVFTLTSNEFKGKFLSNTSKMSCIIQ